MQKNNSGRLEFSTLSGYNFYQFPNGNIEDITTAIHVPSDTTVRVVPLGSRKTKMTRRQAKWYSAILLDPVLKDCFEWPVDIVETVENNDIKLYYIFNQRAYPKLTPLKNLLYENDQIKKNELDWRNPWVMTICKNLLVAFAELDKNGYMYHNFDMNQIFYNNETGEVLLKYTTKLRRKGSDTVFDEIDCRDIATEFAPPYIYKKEKYTGKLDEYSDYYQIAALIFRLMIGRLPYEGNQFYSYGTVMKEGFPMDPGEYKQYFWAYHNYPHFIFDETDKTNELGATFEHEAPKQRWALLPEEVKAMFRLALRQSTAMRDEEVSLPTPAQWLKVIEALTKNN